MFSVQKVLEKEPLEFNEGDVGFAGGIQVLEPGNENFVACESIKRFGGPSAPSHRWPKETEEEELNIKAYN